MNILAPKDRVKLILFGSLLALLASCSTYKSRTDISTCLERGGRVEDVCIRKSAPGPENIYCTQREYLCMGAMSHEAYAKHKKHQHDLKYNPPPPLSKEEKEAKRKEKEAKRLATWKERLNNLSGKNSLTLNADKFPKLTWLAAKWCPKGSDSKIPTGYFKVQSNTLGGVTIIYSDKTLRSNFYHRVKIEDPYFDLFLASYSRKWGSKVTGRRLKKISDKEFILVKILTEFSKEDIEKNEVYVKCE